MCYKVVFKLPQWESVLPPQRAEVMMHGIINSIVFLSGRKNAIVVAERACDIVLLFIK